METLVRLQEFINTTKTSTFEIIQFQKVSRSSKYPPEIVKSNLHIVTLEEHKLHSIKFYLLKKFARTLLKLYLRVGMRIRMMTLKEVMTGNSDKMSVETVRELVNDSF